MQGFLRLHVQLVSDVLLRPYLKAAVILLHSEKMARMIRGNLSGCTLVNSPKDIPKMQG